MSGAYALLTGAALSAGSSILGGYARGASADRAAGQLGVAAGQSVASGIQGAIKERRRGAYVLSDARAKLAASGGTTTDPSAVITQGEIAGEGEYRARTALYEGEDRAYQLMAQASGLRREGSAARTGGWISGISSVLTGGSSWYDKYGQNRSPDAYAADS